MAEQSRRATRGSGRPGRCPSPSAADVSPITGVSVRRSTRPARQIRAAAVAGRSLMTGPTYERLLLGGLSPIEAANLTAFLCGLPLGSGAWRLSEVNRLLFLRELHRAGRLGGERRLA